MQCFVWFRKSSWRRSKHAQQKSPKEKRNYHFLWYNLRSSIFHTNRGWLSTICTGTICDNEVLREWFLRQVSIEKHSWHMLIWSKWKMIKNNDQKILINFFWANPMITKTTWEERVRRGFWSFCIQQYDHFF